MKIDIYDFIEIDNEVMLYDMEWKEKGYIDNFKASSYAKTKIYGNAILFKKGEFKL